MELFLINYQLKIAVKNNGEFSNEYDIRTESMTNTSNFLPEILTDIYEKHRHEWLMAVEIQDVTLIETIDVEQHELVHV
ncbi:hypothetical protein [Cytophaga hutchinsonii]|jgi:hypothetical protein|uniref:Uncharacterized protein n=1 Tax=Cytophaga hutchinsonii (strain ATCC 33406 / DSM 1761 / CIP 103989 / NBRC 15051 / NCIMB 9469 / D465) TaxID=269798 RepID=A0A6N4SR76_CYTH3|nr:hypothetical protein [Cytophaga hutchinsonii]ABG58888.1 hypothetical protein CHU_1618 [Cytophaga hutchinsonii ATCC 33406]SFX81399.1 hypothetical protein SAMN04487930_11086 [Cytophaga hutchinsonii ATCC 33406]